MRRLFYSLAAILSAFATACSNNNEGDALIFVAIGTVALCFGVARVIVWLQGY